MVITLDSELEAALTEVGRRQGIPPETLVLDALRKHFVGRFSPVQPQDEWERQLLSAATDCGVSLPHEALSSEGLYD
jgi:hypothetical protein